MGRKNNKVRQLDGLGLDFDDMFGVESSAPKAKPSKPKESFKGSNAPPPKKKEPLVQPEEFLEPEVDSQDLEQWLQQEEDLKRLQAELASLKEDHQADRVAWIQEREELEAKFRTERLELQSQSVPLKEEIERLKSEILDVKQQSAAEQEELRVTKDEVERLSDAIEKQKRINMEESDSVLLTTLLNERGLRTHGEYTNFFQVVGSSPYGWTLWKDAMVQKESTRSFLTDKVHLISESIRDTSSIPGVCIPVDNDKCELSGGVDLSSEMREVVTEFLLQGWNRVLILGVSKSFVNFVRHHLSTTTIEVQVDARDDQWSYSPDMRSYPVVLIFGGASEKIPESCSSKVFCYDTKIFGQGLHQCRLDFSEE